MLGAWRRRPMTEAQCYARIYGGARHIKVLRPRRRARSIGLLSGEQIRRLFEKRLDSRDREAA